MRSPFDYENSVETGTNGVAGRTRIINAVSETARSLRQSSIATMFPVADVRVPAPPYTWQLVVSQVFAYV